MSRVVKCPSVGKVTLTDADYLSSGGEAEVFVKGGLAYKLYHDPSKMISKTKMKELSILSSKKNIITPKQVIYDVRDNPIGFTMDFIKNTEPLIKLFSNGFKKKNGLGDMAINEVVEKVQSTLEFIHKNKILVVDLNELNLLVSENFNDVNFIDVDSYQTQSAKATAIMASVRDPLVKNNNWDTGSDWFSFAVLAFQMWIGSHPYKGNHPKYKRKEWTKRMLDGVSVFDPDSSLPKMCNDFSVIPPSHYQWMEAVFQKRCRSAPPQIGEASVVILTKKNVVIVNKSFDLSLLCTAPADLLDCYDVMGVKYFVARDGIYKDNALLPIDISNTKKVLFSPGTGFAPVVAKLKNDLLAFYNLSGKEFARISATDMTTRNNIIYSVNGDQLYENTFKVRNGRDIHEFRAVCNIMPNSSRVFDGVILQTMLKKQFAVIPYEKGKCSIINLKELSGSMVIDAKCERNILVILAAKDGLYHRYIFTFDEKYKTYTYSLEEDVVMTDVNFTVLPNGLAVMATESNVVMFKGDMEKQIPNAPFTADNKLFNLSGKVHYIDGKNIYQASVKK